MTLKNVKQLFSISNLKLKITLLDIWNFFHVRVVDPIRRK